MSLLQGIIEISEILRKNVFGLLKQARKIMSRCTQKPFRNGNLVLNQTGTGGLIGQRYILTHVNTII